jgi:putative oxidoreductase
LVPLFDLFIRLWIAKVFFWSGLTKLDDWNSTLFLFEAEYQVPILPVPVAAFLGTTFELVCPILLAVGLASRLAALPLLAMALVIQFVLGAANPAFYHVQHYYWMILLVAIVLRGAGPISLDHAIGKRLARA